MGLHLETGRGELGKITRARVNIEYALATAALEMVMVMVPSALVAGDLRRQGNRRNLPLLHQ
jgi:hypothetical protein